MTRHLILAGALMSALASALPANASGPLVGGAVQGVQGLAGGAVGNLSGTQGLNNLGGSTLERHGLPPASARPPYGDDVRSVRSKAREAVRSKRALGERIVEEGPQRVIDTAPAGSFSANGGADGRASAQGADASASGQGRAAAGSSSAGASGSARVQAR